MSDNRHRLPLRQQGQEQGTMKLKTEDLKREIRHVWNCREVKIIPIVIGALGTVPKGLIKGLELALDLASAFDLLLKVCLLRSARILMKIVAVY